MLIDDHAWQQAICRDGPEDADAWVSELTGLAQDLLAWAKQLLLTGDLACAEPKTVRYRLWHIAAKIACHARHLRLRVDCHWPWAGQLATAFARLHALGAPSST